MSSATEHGSERAAVRTSTPASGRKARRYGFACAPCKTRKVKCSGDQPVCTGCRRLGVDCVWPTSAKSSESRMLRDANERIRHLEGFIRRRSSFGAGSRASVGAVTGEASLPAAAAAVSAGSPARESRISQRGSSGTRTSRYGHTSSVGPSPASVHAAQTIEASPSTHGAAATGSGVATSLWYHVGIGEDGTIIYNGPTSRFHAGSLLDGDGEEVEEDDRDQGDDDSDDSGRTSPEHEENHTPDIGFNDLERTSGHLATLRSQYALMDSVWMPLIAAKPTMNGTGVDTKTGTALLDIYWTWLHPLHHLVYRPVFLMDLALGGPNCSDFLLLCIFALAARHLPPDDDARNGDRGHGQGEVYVERAKALLLEQMAAPTPSIPTIQGLLILGGRECAIGRSSPGWLYTGMAIRMMQDIGLHLDTTGVVGLMERWTPAEIETRKRLYNSAYLWDKTLSLALGRPPSLVRRPYPEAEILDKFDDERPWRPIHATEVAESFVPSPSWVTSTMCVFCRLHEITTDMLLLFSRSPGAGGFTEQIRDLDQRFLRWYEETPDQLKISEPSQLRLSPPPHIVSLNLLYHTLHILLRRPILSGQAGRKLHDEHMGHCVAHSKKIHAIHTLYAQAFPHRLMTYQVSYCIYTAATVEALALKRAATSSMEREEAAARLTSAVRILQNEASHTPGSGKSLDTIRRLLSEGQRQRARVPRQQLRKRRRARSERHQAVGAMGDIGSGSHEDVEMTDNGQRLQMPQYSGGVIQETPGRPRNSVSVEQRSNLEAPTLRTVNAPTGYHSSLWMGPEGTIGSSVGEYDLGWERDVGFYVGTDTGAGFHPDSFSWGFSDDFPRMPPSSLSLTPASASALSSYPVWGSQGWPLPGPGS